MPSTLTNNRTVSARIDTLMHTLAVVEQLAPDSAGRLAASLHHAKQAYRANDTALRSTDALLEALYH